LSAASAVCLCNVLVLASLIHLFWLVAPTFSPGVFRLHWLDLTAFFAIGGLWMAVFLWQLRKRPLLVLHDLDPQGGVVHA
jgi:hypothetical protein